MGESDARLLEDAAVAEYAAQPAAATGTIPHIALKHALAVKLFELGDDTVLQRLQVVFDLIEFSHGFRGRSTLPDARIRISEAPDAGPQSPGTM